MAGAEGDPGVRLDRVRFQVGWILFGKLRAAVERKMIPFQERGMERRPTEPSAPIKRRPARMDSINKNQSEEIGAAIGKTLDDSIEGRPTL